MSRRAHKPTEKTRAQVEALGGYLSQADIATFLGIDRNTLAKHYRRELDTGGIRANARVGHALLKNALGGNVAAQIFWMKVRCHWREVPAGGAVVIEDPDEKRM